MGTDEFFSKIDIGVVLVNAPDDALRGVRRNAITMLQSIVRANPQTCAPHVRTRRVSP